MKIKFMLWFLIISAVYFSFIGVFGIICPWYLFTNFGHEEWNPSFLRSKNISPVDIKSIKKMMQVLGVIFLGLALFYWWMIIF